MSTFMLDLRYTLRLLRRTPGFTVVTILALALGIAPIRPFSASSTPYCCGLCPIYEDPGRLVKIWGRFTGIGVPKDQNWISAPEFVDIRNLSKGFAQIAALTGDSFNVTAGGLPERVEGAEVSVSLFPMLGVQAERGRVFLPEEEQAGRDNVVLLSDALWRRRFGADPNLVGRKLPINGRSFQVVGILPPDFSSPRIAIFGRLWPSPMPIWRRTTAAATDSKSSHVSSRSFRWHRRAPT